MRRLVIFIFLMVSLLDLTAQSNTVVDLNQDRFAFEPGLTVNEDIPDPASFLGYALGEQFTPYAKSEAYFRLLAALSDRISLSEYGTTYEGKPLLLLKITSAANQQRLEHIRKAHLRMLHTEGMSTTETDQLVNDLPVITSFSFNIHGNEASNTEAAQQIAWRFAAANDAATQDILDHSIILLFVCINPDGRDRYVYWYNSMARQGRVGVEPSDLEHYAPWPNGRTNHYWFDLNRDWIWGVHPESRGHTAAYQRWMPQVHVDYHEMGYNHNYFTVPGTTPRNLSLPDNYEAWTDTFGQANVAAFDANRITYYTRESYDFFYPGYGSSYPSVMGAIGMLTEQGGIGAGRAIKTDDGYVLTLRQRIFDHYITSVATIRKAAAHRQALRRYSMNAWRNTARKSPVQAYVFPADQGGYLTDLINILRHHEIDVRQTIDDGNIQGVSYRDGVSATRPLARGSYIVSTDQPRHLFLTAILEPQLEIEDSVMYDMSTWSAPLAYNLEVYATSSPVDIATRPVQQTSVTKGKLVGDGEYAYVLDWEQRHAPRALAMLWEKGYRVRCMEEHFTAGGQKFSPGSLVVLRGRNLEREAQMTTDMSRIAVKTGTTIHSLGSGRVTEGTDLAGRKSQPLRQPRVAMLVEPPFDTYTCGQLYYLFDWETRLPVERIRTSILEQTSLPKYRQRYGRADLNDYDVLLLAGGGPALKELFGKDALPALKSWVQRGGILIATESAAEFFTKDRSKFTQVKLSAPETDTSEAARYLTYQDREDYYGQQRIPGSAMRATVDVSHPLGFGVKKDLYTLTFNRAALLPTADWQSVGVYHRDSTQLLAGGYANQQNLHHLAGKTFAGVQPLGRGKVVLLLNNTQYRMFWRGPSRMMQNAVMLLPSF